MIFDISLVKAESIIDLGASELKRINDENWWNFQFTFLLAGIAVFVVYFLVKSNWLLQMKQEKKGEIEEDFSRVSETRA